MRAWILAFAVLVWPAVAAAQSADQAEALGRLYADAVNTPSGVDAFLAIGAEVAPEPAVRSYFEAQRWITGGGVELVGSRFRPGAPGVVEVAVRSKVYGAVQGVELTLTGGSQPRIANLDLTPAPAWAAPQPTPVSRKVLARKIGRLVDKGCVAGLFSGAVLVAARDDVLLRKACGEASRRYHVANTPGTRFNLGSMDKMFTAVAAAQLAEAGRLSFDATLDAYLDADWLDPEAARQVTVWQLMTHTSGLTPDIFKLVGEQPDAHLRTLDDYRALTRQTRPSFRPGERFEYNDIGMLLLGAVIEKASGEDYYAYVRSHVFHPAGMFASGSFALDDPAEDLAMGYMRAPDSPHGWRENTLRSLPRGIPAGGGYSTVDDLHRFAAALHSGKLISMESRDRLWTDGGSAYGAGFEIGHGAIGTTVGHSGFFRGVSTQMRIYLDRGYTVVVLANIDRAAPPLVDAIEGELLAAP